MTRISLAAPLLCLAATLQLAGCGSSSPSTIAPNMILEPGPPSGSILGDESLSLGIGRKDQRSGSGQAGMNVNAYLWRAALDTLAFMPLSSADPFGGVIITDWYAPPVAQGERFKANVYVLSPDLRSDGVKVVIFRQVDQQGNWQDATVSQATANEIENKILDRARRMREQGSAS
ncbi:MAG: DUF3576 domain-containing protein [Acetobacteraceae bacterium]